MDTLDDAQKMIQKHHLTLTVAYGLNAQEFCGLTGAFFHEKRGFIHATGFILQPDGVVADAVYSTGPIGRLTAGDTLLLIGFRAKKPV
jgi:hypothetical protein